MNPPPPSPYTDVAALPEPLTVAAWLVIPANDIFIVPLPPVDSALKDFVSVV